MKGLGFCTRNRVTGLQEAARILLGTVAATLLMEYPSFDPTHGNPYHTGAVLSIVWSVGILSWALRVTRSHKSRFTVKTLLLVISVIAVGLVNIFAGMVIVG